MALNTLQGIWHNASYLSPLPAARCGHICVCVDKLNEFGTEVLVLHGGINAKKIALNDLAVLSVAQEEWLAVQPSAVGPAARAFHAACVIGPKVFIFAGHVYLPDAKKLHQFNDLWALDTDTWQWSRMDAAPDAPCPVPRDRACMVALDDHRVLIYGGADAAGKRLDDLWVYDLLQSSWKEVGVVGNLRPRPRCSAALFTLGTRVLAFGGDAFGPSNELWSLKGLSDQDPEAIGAPQWTQLQLEGALPAPRRGHAVAVANALNGVVFSGGFSEQKTMLGMKKQSEYLADVALLQRQRDTLAWRMVETVETEAPNAGKGGPKVAAGPLAREKHTMCALQDGRIFLFGGTDGTTTLGDAWWLSLEDIAPPAPDLISILDFEKTQQQQQPVAAPSEASHLSLLSSLPPVSPAAAGAASSYWGVLPSLPTVPGLATLTSLRDRLPFYGAPADPKQESAAQAAPTTSGATAEEALLAVGRMSLSRQTGSAGAAPAAATSSGATPEDAPSAEALVRAAREYFSTCASHEMRLGELPVLLADYRRLARVGWATLMGQQGPEALLRDEVALPGRFAHWAADDVRLKDVAPILEDYRALLAATAMQHQQVQGRQAELQEQQLEILEKEVDEAPAAGATAEEEEQLAAAHVEASLEEEQADVVVGVVNDGTEEKHDA